MLCPSGHSSLMAVRRDIDLDEMVLIFATGPALGPVLSGFAVPLSTWRWSMYETLIISGATLILLFFCLPETNADYILSQRAKRLRAKTGDNNLLSRSESKSGNKHWVKLTAYHLTMPFKITFLDPSVLFINLYTALVYGIYVSSSSQHLFSPKLILSLVLVLRILPACIPWNLRLLHWHHGRSVSFHHHWSRNWSHCLRKLGVFHLRAVHAQEWDWPSGISTCSWHLRSGAGSGRHVHFWICFQKRHLLGCANSWHCPLCCLLICGKFHPTVTRPREY
jgi:MFS family permease